MLWGLPKTDKKGAPEKSLKGKRKLIVSCFMITSPEFCLFNVGITWTFVLWPSMDSRTCQWNDYFCDPVIVPICLIHNLSSYSEKLQLTLLHLHAKIVFKGGWLAVFVFRELFLLWEACFFFELCTKCYPSHNSAEIVLFYYLYHLCIISFTSFYCNFDHIYMLCLYHIYMFCLSLFRWHSFFRKGA